MVDKLLAGISNVTDRILAALLIAIGGVFMFGTVLVYLINLFLPERPK